jgi:hypothetical protein
LFKKLKEREAGLVAWRKVQLHLAVTKMFEEAEEEDDKGDED